MKIVALLLIAFVILLVSFPLHTKANAASSSSSKRDGEQCITTPQKSMALGLCFDGIASGMKLPTSCCERMNEQRSCLCDAIKDRSVTLASNVLSSHLESCGIPDPKC